MLVKNSMGKTHDFLFSATVHSNVKYQSKIVITFPLITAQYISGPRNWVQDRGRTLNAHPLLLVHTVSYKYTPSFLLFSVDLHSSFSSASLRS